MALVFFALTILVCLFISIVNFYYQKVKYKYSTDEELKKLSLLQAPSTWSICIILFALLLVGTLVMAGNNIVNGFSNMGNQENIINQYQNDSSYGNTNQKTSNGLYAI